MRRAARKGRSPSGQGPSLMTDGGESPGFLPHGLIHPLLNSEDALLAERHRGLEELRYQLIGGLFPLPRLVSISTDFG